MNLPQVLFQSFQKYSAKPAILFEGRSYSFREIDEEISKRALWLQSAGIKKGDRFFDRLHHRS